ncbi:MAG: DUF2169 domain-containing protein [Geobacteraceae bacterium]|nr:DUF2169 domain-containing protein [Geobacteraceae bacterium]
MDYVNTTPYSSLAFQATDQHRQSFQVVVLRATFEMGTNGSLQISNNQEAIVLNDEFFGEPNKSSVRQESDLVPYKPKCDIIVNATAYAPGSRPALGFVVGVRVNGTPGKRGEPGPVVLDKKLVVTGARYWEKGFSGRWKLKPPTAPNISLPLRYEYAFGGECRIDLEDPDGQRVDAAFHLTEEQRACHPDGPDSAPIAHTVCKANPVGVGFAEQWYLDAKQVKKFPAPRIDSPDNPVALPGETYVPQGYGIISKTWKNRLTLAGTYDDAWHEKRFPYLPEDFDSAFWNGAHPDMQIPYLAGNEEITLTNLTPEGTLTFRLPGQTPLVRALYANGSSESHPALLDTLIIEPDLMKISLVWRAMLPDFPDRTFVEARSTLL